MSLRPTGYQGALLGVQHRFDPPHPRFLAIFTALHACSPLLVGRMQRSPALLHVNEEAALETKGPRGKAV